MTRNPLIFRTIEYGYHPDDIISYKRSEVEERKSLYPTKLLNKQSIFLPLRCHSQVLKRADLNGIIAEIKRKSPSQGDINPYVSVERVSIGYMGGGFCSFHFD